MEPQRPPHLITTHDLALAAFDGRRERRSVSSGLLHHVKRGAFFPRAEWDSLTQEQRHNVKIYAVRESHPGSVFSHHSAAVIHGLPIVGRWPSDVQVAAQRASGGRSEPGLHRYCRGLDESDIGELGGIPVTSIERTLVDLATVMPFAHVIPSVDYALREGLATAESLAEHLARAGRFRGLRRARRALEFGNPLSESPGESFSRAVIHELGFPAPQLQVSHPRPGGGEDRSDFEWPDFGTIGEFDGRVKYFDPAHMSGQTSAEVVYEEKRREDRLRARARAFARWNWDDAWKANPLRTILLTAGLPLVR